MSKTIESIIRVYFIAIMIFGFKSMNLTILKFMAKHPPKMLSLSEMNRQLTGFDGYNSKKRKAAMILPGGQRETSQVSKGNLATSLKQLMKEKGYSYETLSRASGVGKSKIFGWVQGSVPRNLDDLLILSRLLKVSLDELCLGPSGKSGRTIQSDGF